MWIQLSPLSCNEERSNSKLYMNYLDTLYLYGIVTLSTQALESPQNPAGGSIVLLYIMLFL